MKKVLTQKQQQLLDFIQHHLQREGHPPTIREIGREFGYRSTGTVRDYLRALESKGYLRTVRHKSRGLLPQNWSRLLRSALPMLPILGRVPAGGPLLVDENIEGTVDLSREFGGEKVFALKVWGDSMLEAGVCDGDLVVVRGQDHAETGEIVVALVEGEATVKKLARRNGRPWLDPANPRYEPIAIAGETKILGKVIGVIRSYERRW